jgi:hypothetical protein
VSSTASAARATIALAQPIIDAFHAAVLASGRHAAFKPDIEVATIPGAPAYVHARRCIVLVPWEIIGAARQEGMERFARIGTLGLTGQEQYAEIFNSLLVAHEMGHWVQELARVPLNRWQAEYEANRMMVAFWREQAVIPAVAPADVRLANFVAEPPGMSLEVGLPADVDPAQWFNENISAIEARPSSYAWFQKRMVQRAMSESPAPSFADVLATAWPL